MEGRDVRQAGLVLATSLSEIVARLLAETARHNWQGQTLLENALQANLEVGKFLSVYEGENNAKDKA